MLLLVYFQTNQAFGLNGFCPYGTSPAGRQFNIQHGKSDVIFAADFYFLKSFRNLEKLKNNKKAFNCGWTQKEVVEECKISALRYCHSLIQF